MDKKYFQAITAGVIGGTIAAILILLRNGATFIGSDTPAMLLNNFAGICTLPLLFITMFLAGVVSVRLTMTCLKNGKDAVITGAVAGGLTGVIAEIVEIVCRVVMPHVSSNYYSTADILYGRGVESACCCGPIYVIAGLVFAVLGAMIYYSIRTKQ